MLHSKRLPRLELVLTFVLACGFEEDQAAAWRAAWERIKARESDPLPAARQAFRGSGPRTAGTLAAALTPREAAAAGIPKREYEQAALFARIAVKEHQRLGTPRYLWEPTPIVNDKLAAPFIMDGERELASRLEKEADPALDKSQGLVENVKASLDEIAEYARPIATPESGPNYPAAEAAARVRQHDETIERDEAAGKRHHQRASVLLRRLATWAPWLEAVGAVGFLTFVTYYLNVPLFEPWQDWLGWSFAVVVVVVIILGQTWLVGHAAKSHNHAREARVNGHRSEAEQGVQAAQLVPRGNCRDRRPHYQRHYLAGYRRPRQRQLRHGRSVVFAAAVTGLVLPILAYLGIALDGSTVSRERDGLAAELKDDLDDYSQTLSDSRRDLVIVGGSAAPSGTRRSRISATQPRRRSTPSTDFTAPCACSSAACRPSYRPGQPTRSSVTRRAPSADTSGPASRAPAPSTSTRSSTASTAWTRSRPSGPASSTGSTPSRHTRQPCSAHRRASELAHAPLEA